MAEQSFMPDCGRLVCGGKSEVVVRVQCSLIYRAAMARAGGARKQRTEISVEDADAAILLGQYQVKQREYYAPALGDDKKSQRLNLVRQTIKNAGAVTLRELKDKVHASRFSEHFDWALAWLAKHEEILIQDLPRKQKLIVWVKER
jgi:hypothetical protein